MKAHRPLKRALRALALTTCAFALALPAAAGARPIIYHSVSQLTATTSTGPIAPSAYHAHGRPSAYSAVDEPSSDVQTPRAGFGLPPGFHTDAQSPAKPATSTAPAVVVREVHTVTNGSDHTLAIVLASCALGIALCGSGYAVSRTVRLQRRVAGSSS
jgi:hypothetical protein